MVYLYAIAQLGLTGKPEFFKIGISRNPTKRLQTLQIGSPWPLQLVKEIAVDDRSWALHVEEMVHRHLYEHRATGEWFFKCSKTLKAIEELDLWAE